MNSDFERFVEDCKHTVLRTVMDNGRVVHDGQIYEAEELEALVGFRVRVCNDSAMPGQAVICFSTHPDPHEQEFITSAYVPGFFDQLFTERSE